EDRLKQQIAEAQELLDAQKQSQEQLQIEKTQLEATTKETEREITRLEMRTTELSGKIEQWLADYNAKQQPALAKETAQKLLEHPAEWIAEEQQALSAIERAVTQATSVLDERTRQFTQHGQRRPSDESLDKLKQRLQEQKDSRSESQREHNEIGFR